MRDSACLVVIEKNLSGLYHKKRFRSTILKGSRRGAAAAAENRRRRPTVKHVFKGREDRAADRDFTGI